MSFPRKYPTQTGNNHCDDRDWNAMVDRINGFSPSGTFRSPYSFLIDFDGTDYYANNAFQVVYGGPDDAGGKDGASLSAVVQAANDDLPSNGGVIRMAKGDFALDDTITLSRGVSLLGEGSDAPFTEVSTLPVTKITWTGGAAQMIMLDQTNPWFGKIENLFLDGASTATTGIQIDNAQGSTFRNLRVKNCVDQDLLLQALAAINGNCLLNLFENVFTTDSINALCLKGESGSNVVTLNTFLNCRFAGSGTDSVSVRVWQWADSNTWIGGRIECRTTTWGIVLNDNGASESGVYQNTFIGGALDSVENDSYGLLINKTTNSPTNMHNLFTNMIFGGYTYASKVQIQNSGLAKFLNCPGFLTVNQGTSTGTGAEQTIAHGLGATPNLILLSNIEDGANPYCSTGVDATNLYITAVAGKDYSWRVEVVYNG